MRGDLALQLRVALRSRGVLGIVALAGAVATVVAVYLPWYEVQVRVEALDHTQAGAVTAIPGWQAQPWIWSVAGLAIVAAALGIALAIDRPPSWTREGLLAVAVGIALVAGASATVRPPDARFLADDRLRRLHATIAELPEDVQVDLGIRPATGIWVSLAGSALLVATAFAVREV